MTKVKEDNSIVLTVGGIQLRFEPNMVAYSKYINEMQPNDKMAPIMNYLRRIILPADKENLNDFLSKPGMAMKLLNKVNELYECYLDIEVKN